MGMFSCCSVITDYAAKRAREAQRYGRADYVVLLAEACHGVLVFFPYEYPQYFFSPKENKEE